jgi:hypothetical protein
LGFLPNGAGIEQDNIGIVDFIGLIHALGGMKDIGHFFRVILIHLAAKCLDIELFHTPISGL